MVRALHAAGIEVILDVVYNHTAEGNQLGPTLSFRGIDNAHLLPAGRRTTRATTSTSPAPATRSTSASPHVLQLIMDSPALLGARRCTSTASASTSPPTLARELHEVDRLAAFFDIVHQDPVVSPGQADRRAVGHRRGRLPGRQLPARCGRSGTAGTATRVRDFWRGDDGDARRARLPPHRLARPVRATTAASRPPASTSSPRTTASRCTTSSRYNDKHNEANGEDNRDGADDNRSWNCGVEGADRRPGDHRAARAPAAQLPGDAAALAGRADDLRRRRARPHPGRQQQRLLPGQRDLWFDWDARATTRRSSSSRAG